MFGKEISRIIQQYFDVHEKKLQQLFKVDKPMRVIIDKEPPASTENPKNLKFEEKVAVVPKREEII